MSFDIDQAAKLARLRLSPEERERLSREMESILQYVEQLKQVDTSKVSETSHVLDITNVFRKDEICVSSVRDEVLKHAPLREGNFFKVPKVVER